MSHHRKQLVSALRVVVADKINSGSMPMTLEDFESWRDEDVKTNYYDLGDINLDSHDLEDEDGRLNGKGQKEFNDLIAKWNKLSDPFTVYRSICPEGKDIDRMNLGMHWSLGMVGCWGYDYERPESDQYTFKAVVNKSDVWWNATVLHNLHWGEEEITMLPGRRIQITIKNPDGTWDEEPFQGKT